MSREPVALADAVPETLATVMHWHEPDAGCVSCGQAFMTIEDHRCGTCLNDKVRHCPICLSDIEALVDREVARRLRELSYDISQEFAKRNLTRRMAEAREAIAFRQRARDGGR
jgi:hypothetical protein